MVSIPHVLSGISIILLVIYGADVMAGGGGAGDGFLPFDAMTRGIGFGMPPIIFSFIAFFISKKIKVRFIILPAMFVLATTLSALLYLTFKPSGYFEGGNYVLGGISLIMFFLGAYVAKEGFKILVKKK